MNITFRDGKFIFLPRNNDSFIFENIYFEKEFAQISPISDFHRNLEHRLSNVVKYRSRGLGQEIRASI